MHPRFLEIVAAAKSLGFSHIQAASNGLKFADPEFACRAQNLGLQYIYLQMDGTSDDVFQTIRGRALFEEKLAVLQAARTAGLQISVFSPPSSGA